MIFIFSVFTLFWGASYKTDSYYHKVNLIAVVQDDIITPEMEGVHRPLTSVIPSLIEHVPGNWHVYNTTGFAHKYKIPGDMESIDKKMIDLIYSEKFWLGVNIKPNSTANLYNALTNNSTDFFNTTAQYDLIYEGGRDPNTVLTTIYPFGAAVQEAFKTYYNKEYFPSMVLNLTSDRINLKNTLLSGNMEWNKIDYRPHTDRLILTVTQFCCIYLLILTILQFMNFSGLQGEMSRVLNDTNKVIYRLSISVATHFFLSLFFCTITAMLQVDFTKAFGRCGFMIYWMSTWLFMWAVGGANENIVGLIFSLRPQFIGFWITGFVAVNISTAFFPFSLNNNFYRFGYMMPVHNLIEIYGVIFLDTSRCKMGRNYGILVAWIALNTITLPFFMKSTSMFMIKKIKKESNK